MILVCLACTIKFSGLFALGVLIGTTLRGRVDAGELAPHEALRQLYGAGRP